MSVWQDQVKARSVSEVLARASIETVRAGSDVSFPCLACGKGKRHTKGGSDKRQAAKVVREGRGFWCEPCGAKGSALDVAALLVVEKQTGLTPDEWGKVRQWSAANGLCEADSREQGAAPRVAYKPPPPRPPAPELERLPVAEVASLWAECSRLDAAPSWAGGMAWCSEARGYLAGRALDVGTLATLDAARIAPPPDRYSWPAWWPSSWSKTWRVAVPLFDAKGVMVAMQARSIVASEEKKTRNPLGSGVVSGTFFASAGGLEVLRGTYSGPGLVLVEGLTDYLAAAQLAAELEPERRPAVLGVVAGSARSLVATNVKASCRLVVLTDNDEQGERYFREIAAALPELNGFRVRLRPLDGKRADLNDYLRRDKAVAVAALTHGLEG